MAINYPTSLDDGTSLPDQTDNVSTAEAADVNLLVDAIIALETKVGIDASSAATSIDHHLSTAQFIQTGAGDKTTTSGTYEDSGVTASVVVAKTSTVAIIATVGGIVHGDANQTSNMIIYWGSGTEATTEATIKIGDYSNDSHSAATSVVKTGVTAATYTAKIQVKTASASAAFTNIVMTVIVLPESLS